MEGRRIRGERIDHEQDYVRERIEQTGGTADYAEAADTLKEELHDLTSPSQGDTTPAGSADTDMLRSEAGVPTEGMDVRLGDALDPTTNSPIDPEQLPPDAEARARVTAGMEGGTGGTTPGR